MNYLYQNGKELCEIQQLRFYKGRREPYKVAFTVPPIIPLLDDNNNYEIHLDDGNILNILIVKSITGIDTLIEAVVNRQTF